jgi:hypothetical protein
MFKHIAPAAALALGIVATAGSAEAGGFKRHYGWSGHYHRQFGLAVSFNPYPYSYAAPFYLGYRTSYWRPHRWHDRPGKVVCIRFPCP